MASRSNPTRLSIGTAEHTGARDCDHGHRDAKDVVELVGIEPTTASLRIPASVRDGATLKKRE